MFTHKRFRSRWIHGIAALLFLAAIGAIGARPAAAQTDDPTDDPIAAQADDPTDLPTQEGSIDGSYGYVRVLEGAATLIQGDGSRSAAEVNQPVVPGDRIEVARRGRLELVLPDRNLLRLDGGSDLVLEQLAGAPGAGERGDRSTRLRLEQGNVQLVVGEDALGDELPRVDTPNASIYIQYPGTYRVTSDGGDWSSVVVRRGSAEVVNDRGSVRVRADEEAQIEGGPDARAEIAQASGYDAIERWGRDLEAQARVAAGGYLNESLSYEGSALSRYGSWIEVEHHHYWRPTVDGGWRPFTDGYWTYTPAGLSWVATEPWGWVPYHYGSWDFLPGYGWVWEPGTVFSPAWVYWYWGPSYVGWCPIGFYTGWYGRRFHDPAFRFGVYGWAGGDWGHFAHWNFVGIHHFGHRGLNRWIERGGAVRGDLRGDMRMRQLPRGIITTDTRGITPRRWNQPQQVSAVLRGGGRRELPDVTSFVARRPDLPPQVLRAVTADGPTRNRFLGTPLRPVSLGLPPARPANQGPARGGRWADRTPVQAGRGVTRGVAPVTPTSPASPGGGDRADRGRRNEGGERPAFHTWDRRAVAPNPVPRPNPADTGERPRSHTWDRPTTVAPRGDQPNADFRPGERPVRPSPVLPPAEPRENRRAWQDRPGIGRPASPPVNPANPDPRENRRGWRDRPEPQRPAPAPVAPTPRPERWQRPEAPAPRYTPPAPRYTPPAPYNPPAPRYNPPPQVPRSQPTPQRPPERPAERPAQKPPEHHGRQSH
jgi:uncharacterized protein DUF6600/FecR-like protein